MRQRRGLMLVLSSPSGAGKTTLSRRLLDSRQRHHHERVGHHARARATARRKARIISSSRPACSTQMAEGGAFLEHATGVRQHYGTPKEPVMLALAKGRDVLFDIDWQGTQQLRQQAGDDLVSIFVLPPSHDELERRLRARAQDAEDVVAARMARANDEISHWAEYDYVVINDDLDRTRWRRSGPSWLPSA